MGKTFAAPEQRQPRGVNTDPAFRAAASAFTEPAPTPPAPTPQPQREEGHGVSASAEPEAANTAPPETTVEPRAAGGEAASTRAPVQPAPTLAFAPAVLPESKMTIYPGVAERARLATIKAHHRLAESIVAEYALEELFRQQSDDDIAAVLRGRGHSLRRARPAPAR